MKKTFVFLVLVIIFTAFPIAAQAQTSSKAINVYVGGKRLNFDVPPTMDNGRVLVPVRGIFETLGAEVNYDTKANTVNASKGNLLINLPIGKSEAVINGKTIKLDVPAKIIKGRTLVPIRFVSESLGAAVEWDDETKSVFITSLNESYNFQLSEVVKVADLDPNLMFYNVNPLSDASVLIDGSDTDSGGHRVYFYDSKTNVIKNVYSSEEFLTWGTMVLPDDKVWVYTIKRIGEEDLLVVSDFNPRNGNLKELYTFPYSGGFHEVSSQKELVYDCKLSDQTDLFKINAQGETIRLTDTPDIDESWPSWSMDGNKLAYTATPKDEKSPPYVSIIKSDGTGQIKLDVPVSSDTSLQWSPNGKLLAYILWDQTDNNKGIWVVNSDGSSGKKIYSQRSMGYVIWSPDGLKLYGTIPIDKHVVMNPDGSDQRMLFNAGYPVSWTEDSKILYVKDEVLYLWDLREDKLYALLEGPIEEFWRVGNDIYCISQNQIWKTSIIY